MCCMKLGQRKEKQLSPNRETAAMRLFCSRFLCWFFKSFAPFKQNSIPALGEKAERKMVWNRSFESSLKLQRKPPSPSEDGGFAMLAERMFLCCPYVGYPFAVVFYRDHSSAYSAALPQKRIRIAANWARVAVPEGFKVPWAVPPTMPLATDQRIASAA